MFQKTRSVAVKYGARIAAVPVVFLASAAAHAAGEGTGASVVQKVTEGMTQGELITTTVVLGIFAMWCIKLLLKAK